MSRMGIPQFPIQLATRLVLGPISYTSPLPLWLETLTVDYSARDQSINGKIGQYLNGIRPRPPFRIMVPKRNGAKRFWVVPSINDQIIIQAVVCLIAQGVDRTINEGNVLSYRYNTHRNRLQLTNSQISAWNQFQSETDRRLKSRPHLLQLDLQEAFPNINRAQFVAFVGDLVPHRSALELFTILLDSFAGQNAGVPLVSDSLFFLGNGYLSVVDKIVRRYSTNFIRFVDDYRVFGESRESLERILSSVSRDLEGMGFKVNVSKIKLGSSEEYYDALAKGRYAATGKVSKDDYISAAVFEDVVEPELLVELVARALKNPERYLNEGAGRLTLGAVRRMRLDAVAGRIRAYIESPRDRFTQLLARDGELVGAAVDLLESYSRAADEEWRIVWLLYLMEDMQEVKWSRRKLVERMSRTVRTIEKNPNMPPVVRLWAKRVLIGDPVLAANVLEEIHEADYLDAGVRCLGGMSGA